MECRSGCGACCIAPSITSPIPGMPGGKPANSRCVNLDEQYRCIIFNDPARPQACADFKAEANICGDNREQALRILNDLEQLTQ